MKRRERFQMAEGRPEHEADRHLSRYRTAFFPIPIEQHRELLTQTGFRVCRAVEVLANAGSILRDQLKVSYHPIEIFEFKIYGPLKI